MKIKEILRWSLVAVIMGIGFYSTIVRFKYPELTETQLFLKLIGM